MFLLTDPLAASDFPTFLIYSFPKCQIINTNITINYKDDLSSDLSPVYLVLGAKTIQLLFLSSDRVILFG